VSTQRQAVRSFLVGGLLPVIAFTVIEEVYGTVAGLIAGMVFGVGEILWEYRTRGQVDPITWGGNALILVLGGISLFTNEGVWFKLQPALLEIAMTAALWGSWLLKKPLLLAMSRKQGGLPEGIPLEMRQTMEEGMSGLTLRLGVFFALHAALAVWAALHWSTAAWAILKGVGLTVSLMVYLVVETLLLRYRVAKWKKSPIPTPVDSP
jgi:intracellular septation protein